MPVTRADVADALALHPAEALQAIMAAARVSPRGAEHPRELAERIADALWWHYCTPLGYLATNTTLEDMVGHVARRAGVANALHGADAWEQLRELTVALVRELGPVGLEDLDPKLREKLWPSWVPPALYGLGAGGSYGARVVGKAIIRLSKTPVGRVLPLLPAVGPWFRALRTGAGAAATVGGPLAIGLGLLSVNSSFGTNYQHLVPLLLGVGALGPAPVEDAEIVVPEEDDLSPDEPEDPTPPEAFLDEPAAGADEE